MGLLVLINLVINLAAIVLLHFIFRWTKNDPLENLKLYNELPDTLYFFTEILSTNELSDTLDFNTEIFRTNIFPEEEDYKDNKTENLLRYLDDDCNDFNSRHEANNYEMNKVFILSIKDIHVISAIMLFLFYFYFGFLTLIIVFRICVNFEYFTTCFFFVENCFVCFNFFTFIFMVG